MSELRYTASLSITSSFAEGCDVTRRMRFSDELFDAYSYVDAMVDMAARAGVYDHDVSNVSVTLYDAYNDTYPVNRLWRYNDGTSECYVFDETMTYTEYRDAYKR